VRGQSQPPAKPRLLRITKTGFDGTAPGPEFRVKRGEEFAVHVLNEFDEPTAIHWHGVRLANVMDGAPPLTQAPIASGASFEYRFVAPDAGTFWYHPFHPISAELCGAFIVEETTPLAIDQDLTLLFAKPSTDSACTVNGAATLDIRARANERVRLRLLNTSADQLLELRVAGLRTFVMATDGQPAQPFVARDGRLILGPGNRTDVFVDCTLMPGRSSTIMVEHAGDSVAIATIACETGEAGRAMPRDAPQPLPPNPLPERMDFRDAFRLETPAGQARAVPTEPSPLFRVKRGRTVMLGLSNPTSESAVIHLHGHSFRLLDALDDGWKPFWLDTMPIAPRGKARIAFVADNPGKWRIEGLGPGLGSWFEVS
jgi:FtsP/CotA-like multicopper oxidase with cupredoxin domain